MKQYLNKIQIAASQSEDANGNLSTWKDGKLVSLNLGEYTEFYFLHESETVQEETPDGEQTERTIVRACAVQVKNPALPVSVLKEVRRIVKESILAYDASDKVNSFFLDDQKVWFSKEMRASLSMRIESEKSEGKTETTLWVGTQGIMLPLSSASQMLRDMELYASQCYDTTLRHLSSADKLKDIDLLLSYDYTSGYPDVICTTTQGLQAKAADTEIKSPEAQAVTFARAMVNTVSLSANQALEMKVLFPVWGVEAKFGQAVKAGFRLRVVEGDSDTLFEAIKDHTLQESWKPGMDTASLYKVVTEEHAGTLNDPIPYKQGMAFTKDLYYTQYGVTYLCILTTTTGYPNDLKDLPTIVQEV